MKPETNRKLGKAAGNRGKGRKPGVKNKMTVAAKEAFAAAFCGIGGTEALTKWAKSNPTEFFKLYARLIPTELTGKDGGAIQFQNLTEPQIDERIATLMANVPMMRTIHTEH